MDDDGTSIMLKLTSCTLAGTASESRISLDNLQDSQAGTPAPLHANANPRPNDYTRARISVDITQRPREGSVEITLARTVEEDAYGIDAAPRSDTTIFVEHTPYAAGRTHTSAPA